MGIFLANRDAPSRCTATDCLVWPQLTNKVALLANVLLYYVGLPTCNNHPLCHNSVDTSHGVLS